MSFLHRALVPFGLALALFQPVQARGDAAYLRELQRKAEALRLEETPKWRALLHYRENRLGPGVSSVALGDTFFLAEDGQTNPKAELAATLASFFQALPPLPGGEHPQCAFTARYHWLAERLVFDAARLPPQSCAEFDAWFAELRPSGLTLIFPEAFMNNPASMFGHTLLRVDRDGADRADDLMAYTINFAADAGGDPMVVFAFKGVFGFYPGRFSVQPYYQKVKQYGDWENRDIWEYRLDLSDGELKDALNHLWELRDVHFRYYFFDDNCSYQLLGLLDVARPELRLSDGFPLWALPIDTVRSLVQKVGLVEEVRYRPSPATQLQHRTRSLSRNARKLALELSRGELDPGDPVLETVSERERADALSVAYDYLRYRYLAGEVSRDESAGRARRILVARSRVAGERLSLSRPSAPKVRPDRGHPVSRFAMGSGFRDDRYFVEARLRPSFHALMDPPGGYTDGAQIVLLDTAVRYFPERESVRLYEAVLIDIVSLSPRDRFLDPIAWEFNTGMRTRLLPDRNATVGRDLDREAVWRSEGGAGFAFDLGSWVRAYGFGEARIEVAPALRDKWTLGPGGRLGFFVGREGGRWRGHAFAQVFQYAIGDVTTAVRTGVEQSFRISRRMALQLNTEFERSFGLGRLHARLLFGLYF
ncbi:MAG: DUF4105 domain-containing protein [Myxococcota bacterium]